MQRLHVNYYMIQWCVTIIEVETSSKHAFGMHWTWSPWECVLQTTLTWIHFSYILNCKWLLNLREWWIHIWTINHFDSPPNEILYGQYLLILDDCIEHCGNTCSQYDIHNLHKSYRHPFKIRGYLTETKIMLWVTSLNFSTWRPGLGLRKAEKPPHPDPCPPLTPPKGGRP